MRAYQNDYKKKLGIDQTRTASEKVLDKYVKMKPKEPENQPNPTKKIKTDERKPTSNKEIRDRLMATLEGNQVNKVIKALKILDKCLHEQNFIIDPQINTSINWRAIFERLRNIFCSGSEKDIREIAQLQLQAYVRLRKLLNIQKDDKKQHSQLKDDKKQHSQLKDIPKLIQGQNYTHLTNSQAKKQNQIECVFCQLFTDDSFIFAKKLIEFKKIFCLIKQNTTKNDYIEEILLHLFRLPYHQHKWIFTGLNNLYKEFNNQTVNLILYKKYLQKYNQFINSYQKQQNKDQQTSSNNLIRQYKQSIMKINYQEQIIGIEKWVQKQ